VTTGPHDRAAGAGERLAGLVRLARVMAESRSLRELVEATSEEARFAFGARTVSLSRFEPEHGLIRTLVNVGALAPGEERFPDDETYELSQYPLLAAMVDEARPWTAWVDDPACDVSERELMRRLGVTSSLGVPVFAEGRVWGELFATRDAGVAPYDDEDLGYASAFAGMLSAGLAQVQHLAVVETMAYRDPLTGLGNRRLVEESLERALAAEASGGGPVTVVMADVNRLKQANDAYGHEAGDRALVAVAHALSVATGRVPGAVAGRMGGDEFCSVLPGQGLAVGEALAAAFLRGTADAPYGVSVACGVASTQLEEAPHTAARLFALADAAQYQAKRAGSAHPVIATPGGSTDRRSLRGRDADPGLLAAALATLERYTGRPVVERVAAAAEAVSVGSDGSGWVLSRLRDGAALPVDHGVRREGVFLASVPAPASAAWVVQARGTGLVVAADDDEVPLAGVRGVARVVVAVAGDWMVEVLCDGPPPPADAAAVLRAALGVALSG
jgi:diguanylate cyclase (GGDEF)-like protein